MPTITIHYTEVDLMNLVREDVANKTGLTMSDVKEGDVIIEVKSSQNYKSEWEKGNYRAHFTKIT